MNSGDAERSSMRHATPTRMRRGAFGGLGQVHAWLIAIALLPMLCSARETPAEAAMQQAAPAETSTLETIVVSGEQPGPGLWKVSKGGHVLWILGTLSPLPEKMTWASRDIEATIARSQQIILVPSASISVKGGMLRGLFLLPSLAGARNNPEDARLVEVVPADLYARWSTLKQRYIGRDRGIEKRRPIFAAQELYVKAIKHSGMTLEDVVSKAVEKAARRQKVERVEPRLELRIESPGKAVREFRKSALDDIDCFAKTLSRLETDLEAMKQRANAWASGDIEAIRALPYDDQFQACGDAVLKASVVEERGLGDLRERIARVWLEAAEVALERNDSTLAILPIRLLLQADGALAALRERGYLIEEPP
jgi:uncharacterized protein YbaP (TraB family)